MLLCLNPVSVAKQTFLVQTMRISRAYASTILKKLAKWNLVERGRIRMKGRANGRQLGYFLGKEARERLDKDLLEFDFFRNSVRETVRPIALCFNRLAWRQDLGLLDRET
jgi:DNA-binding MarR family transcriptional regulator